MQNEKSISKQAVWSLLVAILCSLIFSSLFGKLYLFIFNPLSSGGLAGWDSVEALGVVQNSIFAFPFFLSLTIAILVSKKQWLVWFILIFFPFTMNLVGGSKYLLCFIIFTITGSTIGWLIRRILIKKRMIKEI